MIETYYAGSYWLARRESAEACARRAERFFRLLKLCDPAWTRWYETADSFEEARKLQFRTDASSFQKLDEGPVGERILTASVMTEVLRAMALAWEPEWGVATSLAARVHELLDRAGLLRPFQPWPAG